jgi:hypothetical protein
MSLTKLFLAGNNLIIPRRESLVGDIPVGDGKIANLLKCRLAGSGHCDGVDKTLFPTKKEKHKNKK